jgi:hypothetical protein
MGLVVTRTIARELSLLQGIVERKDTFDFGECPLDASGDGVSLLAAI